MSLAAFGVRRPIFTTMIVLIALTLGVVSLLRLRIDMLPAVELPRLTVRTDYDGASPEVMERLVTQMVEEIIATVPGVEELTSESSEGRSQVRVTFGWGSDIDVAAQDVRAILEQELEELPDEVSRPQLRKFDIASFPVVVLGIASKLDPVDLTELIDQQVRYRFARIPGVAQVDMWGGYEREVRVELAPDKVRALRIPLPTIISSLRNANLDRPAGDIEQGRYEVTLRAPSEFQNLEQIRQTVVAVRDGVPVTLGELGEIKDTYAELSRIVRVNGELGVRLAVRKQADANTVEVAKAILSEIERVNRDYPLITVVPVINQGNFIEQSISNVARSVLYGGGLAILILLFFLRNLRSTGVISLAIPISVIATFALIYTGGLTLNLMTLGGLALGVGMMVDSSIVVLENIYRRREELGESPAAAAVAGTREVSGAVIASTITTLVIFLPLLFVQGVSGILFGELALVVAFSLACALLVALSLVPMLASRFLHRAQNTAPETGLRHRMFVSAGHQVAALNEGYTRVLTRALANKSLTLAIAGALVFASFLLYSLVGSEFMPPSDEGQVEVSAEMEVGTRLGLVDRQSKVMEDIVSKAVPEAVSSVVSVGSGGYRGADVPRGRMQLSLVPAAERDRSNQDIARDLRKELEGKVAGARVRVRAPQGQFLLERLLGGTSDSLTIEIRGYEFEILGALAEKTEAALATVSGITDVEVSRIAGVPEKVFRVDRAKAAQLGLSPKDVADALEIAVAGRRAGEYRPTGESYRILVQLGEAETLTLDDVLDIALYTPSGRVVALRNVVSVEERRGPMKVDRKDQQRIVQVSANVSGRDLGSVADDATAALAQIPRPFGYELRVAGNFEEQEDASRELSLSLLLAVFLVYMVLACQYESLRDPLVVMLSVPVAAFGALFLLWVTNTTLNVQSYIGCIMLGGIVVNNAILLVDQARALGGAGMGPEAAVLEAGRRRLRPILMTTLTTIIGLLPLALGIGEGAEAQAPLARAVIGGLTGSTVITLVLIPVVYTVLHRPLPE